MLQCVTGPDGRALSLTHRHTLPRTRTHYLCLSLSLSGTALLHMISAQSKAMSLAAQLVADDNKDTTPQVGATGRQFRGDVYKQTMHNEGRIA